MNLVFKVYKVTNLVNGKIYVGKTQDSMFTRLGRHRYEPRSQLRQPIQEFGIDNFKIEKLQEYPSNWLASKAEKAFISELNATDKSIGYNIMHGYKHADETKKKIQNTMKNKSFGNDQMMHIQLLGLSKKGTKASDATRKKLSESHIGQTAWNSGLKLSTKHVENLKKSLTGRKLSESHKEAIRQGHLKRKLNG